MPEQKQVCRSAVLLLVVAGCVGNCRLGRAEELGHPTLEEFKEEVLRADLIVRGSVTEVVDEWEYDKGVSAQQMLKVNVDSVYKGRFQRPQIIVSHFYWEPSDARKPGDDVVVLLNRVNAFSGDPKPFGQEFYFLSSFLYEVKDGNVMSPTGMAEDLAAHKSVEKFITLIKTMVMETRWAHRRLHLEEWVPGKVLFSDDFNDGSTSGWTLLKGARPGTPKEDGAYGLWGEIWMADGVAWKNAYFDQAGTIGRLSRGKAGLLTGERDSTQVQIGVYDGRLRLRSNHLLQHTTIVAGNPNWTDYQVDVDMINRGDRLVDTPELIAQDDYRLFGVLGRVAVPNLPKTEGEHCEIGIEFGNYSNLGATWIPVGRSTVQIRLKTADADSGRDAATRERKTKILDFQTYDVSKDRSIHVTAKFMGSHVEGWIDGKKYVEGVIPESNRSRFERGRIALWVFETFAEFDNVKVTELVRKDAVQ